MEKDKQINGAQGEGSKTDQIQNENQEGEKEQHQFQQNSDSETNYVGLSNIGATCYMNSVLQTLFMTPEFRENIYQWRQENSPLFILYNIQAVLAQQRYSVLNVLFNSFTYIIKRFNAEDSQAEDCIPLQLQILFAKMQLRSFPYVDTKDLAKSFGWDNQDGWEQHDTQEFVRILLDAIEKSFHGSKNYNFINDIYEGASINYVRCLECKHESITQENFLDLVVTVKNMYDKIYNDSLEKCIQRYIKPETLENDNMYMCNKCNKKVNAQRGTRFFKLPKILSFIMNRFTFDFQNMKRIKLDDFVGFPFILNMNDYINGYDQIKNKLNEDVDPSNFTSDQTLKPVKPKSGTTATVTSQIKKKVPIKSASTQTRDFLKNLRTQKKFQNEDIIGNQGFNGINPAPGQPGGIFMGSDNSGIDKQEQEELYKAIQQSLMDSQVKSNGDIINYNNSSAETTDTFTDTQNHLQFFHAGPLPDQANQGNKYSGNVGPISEHLNSDSEQISKLVMDEEQKVNGQIQDEICEDNDLSSPSYIQSKNSSGAASLQDSIITNQKIFQSSRVNRHLANKKVQLNQTNPTTNQATTQNQAQQRESSQFKRDQEEKNKQDYKKILSEHLNKNTQDCNEKIEKYLKDGPLVYELYSILIHSGGAYGGHYYAYIKSFEDGGKWHSFNDTSIMEIDVNEIQERVFGGNTTNAYMLFYRQWEPPSRKKLKTDNSLIPQDVINMIEKQKKQWIEQQNWKLEQSKMMSVKVHYILNVKVLQVKSTDTLIKLLDAVMNEFKIKEKRENVRLRRYKPNTDQKLDTFDDIEHLSLDKLKINHFTNLCVEIKKDGEQFEEYDAGTTFVKMAIWRPNILSLEENFLDVIRVTTRRNATIYRLMEQLARASNIDFGKIVVIKKHENIHGINTAEVISTSSNYDIRLEDLGIVEGQMLFVEEKSSSTLQEGSELKWQEVFESDSNKIFIKFNNPTQDFNNQPSSQNQKSPTISTNIEYNNSLIIDSRQTLQQLKEKIAEQLKLDPVQIIIRRGGKAGVELKEMNKTLRSMNFINNSSIYLELGKPAKEGEIRVIFYLAHKTPPNSDNIMHTFEEIGELPIHGNLKASEVKVIASQFLKQKKNIQLHPDFFRLREKISDNLTRIYREKKMREQQVIEKKMIAIEQIDTPQEYNLKDYLIYIRFWNQQTWTLSDRFELLVSKTDSGYDLQQKIYAINQTVSIGNMSAMKINAIWNFTMSQLINSEWFNLDSSDVSMCLHPFHIMNDGNMLMQYDFCINVIKDKTQAPRELTNEEVKQMGIISTKQIKKVGMKCNQQQKEKALSIKVKKYITLNQVLQNKLITISIQLQRKESHKEGIQSQGKENIESKENNFNIINNKESQQLQQVHSNNYQGIMQQEAHHNLSLNLQGIQEINEKNQKLQE